MLLWTPKNTMCMLDFVKLPCILSITYNYMSFSKTSFLSIVLLQYFSYVMSVLYPECLIRLIMDYHSLPFDLVSPCSDLL